MWKPSIGNETKRFTYVLLMFRFTLLMFYCDHGGRSWYMWSWSQEKIINDSKTFALLCVIVHQTKLPVILQVTADKAMIEEVLGQLPTRKIAPGWWLPGNCRPR